MELFKLIITIASLIKDVAKLVIDVYNNKKSNRRVP